MADIADRANEQAEYLLEMAFRLRSREDVREPLEDCEDCDVPIPLARREFVRGCRTCVDCQTLRERGHACHSGKG